METLDIFSKSKKTKKEEVNLQIIADYREKNSLLISQLIKSGVNVNFKELKVADYLVRDIAIERKTVSDFISSMINKRLSRQLEELQQYKNKLLIIEGVEEQEIYSEENNEEKNGIHPNSVRGFLLSILLKYKIPIIFTKNHEDTSKFILVLLKRKEKELSLNVNKKNLNKNERMQFILEGFPGIGPKTAKKLIEKFKSIKNIINAPEEELKIVLGKKYEIIKEIIDYEY